MTDFERAWSATWADLGLEAPPELRDTLLRAYGEAHRHYHTLQHLAECLDLFEQVRGLAERPGEVALALWFHDAIYDPRSKSNERRSADWAVAVLRDTGAHETQQRRIDRLILATRHAAVPIETDERLLVDIDLAILGASPQRFAEYERQVRSEYRWVPGLVYRIKRRSLLRSFLARPTIYATPYFRDRLESRARLNLTAAL